MSTTSSRAARWGSAAVVPVALVASSAMVWQSSNAAFNATTTNGPSSWTAGTVNISDDDSNSAMFNVSGMKPGDTANKCIRVTYTGSLAASVKLYGSVSGALAPYLNTTVEIGDGGTFSNCSGFTPTATIYNGTLSGFGSTHTNFANGAGTWAPTGSGQAKTYRVTYTLQDNNAAQGQSANATFTWEAQNS